MDGLFVILSHGHAQSWADGKDYVCDHGPAATVVYVDVHGFCYHGRPIG